MVILLVSLWSAAHQQPDAAQAQGASEMTGYSNTVLVGSIFGRGSSLAVDNQGRPHISYVEEGYRIASRRLRYAVELEPGLWRFEVLTNWGDWTSDDTSLVLDDAGNPHIGYTHNGRLTYARNIDGSWQVEQIEGVLSSGYVLELLLDGAGQPHMVSTGSGIVYARRTEQGWQTSEIPSVQFDYRYVTLVLDKHDKPHVGFMTEFMDPAEAVHGILYYAYLDDDSWQIEKADFGGGGWHPDLVLDSTGRAHFSYQGGGYNELGDSFDLSYAQRTTAAPAPGEWQIEEVDEYGEGKSMLLLDGEGTPHISYSSYAALERLYASKDALAWQSEEVDYRFGKCISAELWSLDFIERPVLACVNEGMELITWSPAPNQQLWMPAVYRP
jgi:hypothetical protein